MSSCFFTNTREGTVWSFLEPRWKLFFWFSESSSSGPSAYGDGSERRWRSRDGWVSFLWWRTRQFRSGHLVFMDEKLVNSLLHHHVEFNHCSSFFPVREESRNDKPNHLVTLSSLHGGNRLSDFETNEELSGRSGLRSPSPAFTEHQASGSAQHLRTNELQSREDHELVNFEDFWLWPWGTVNHLITAAPPHEGSIGDRTEGHDVTLALQIYHQTSEGG